ncbi:MAG: hypothetical protein KKB22_08400 [Candidatus Omnitrophica bacterium]|nr:hypothetical protein [Candidatus Omnitrophota bacterium]
MKLKGITYKFILAILSVALFFGTLEIALRFIKFHVNQTNGYFKFACFHFISDKYNVPIGQKDPYLFWRNDRYEYFRGRHHPLVKPKDTFRIICMGDSTTQGFLLRRSLPPFNEAYPYMLEELFHKNNMKNFEVINAGTGGYTSFQGLRFLKRDLLNYDPDLLIIWFGTNDVANAIFFSDKEQKTQDKTIAKVDTFLSRSKFCQLYRQALFRLMYYLTQEIGSKKRVSAEDYCCNLKEMANLAKEKGIIPVFIIPFIRTDSQVLSFKVINSCKEYAKIFSEFLDNGVVVIDLSLMFKDKGDLDSYFIDVCHLTFKGNKAVSEIIYDTLIDKGIISNIKEGD